MTYKTRFMRSHDNEMLEKFKAWVKECGLEQDIMIETHSANKFVDDFSKITITGEQANVMFALRWGGPMPIFKEESTTLKVGDDEVF